MSNAMTLLREIPTFNWYSYSKMSQIAYKLKSLNFSPRSTLARAGQKITSVYLVNKGLVQGMVAGAEEEVSLPAEDEDEAARQHRSSLRPTPLYLIQLGRGQLIGQWELLRGLDTFEMTYVTCNSAEVFELNREHFEVREARPANTHMTQDTRHDT
jgi:CRP-like cAMP-binding protein